MMTTVSNNKAPISFNQEMLFHTNLSAECGTVPTKWQQSRTHTIESSAFVFAAILVPKTFIVVPLMLPSTSGDCVMLYRAGSKRTGTEEASGTKKRVPSNNSNKAPTHQKEAGKKVISVWQTGITYSCYTDRNNISSGSR